MCEVEICQVRDAKDTLYDGLESGYCTKIEDAVREAMVEAGLETAEDQIAAASIWLGDIGESDSELKVILRKIRDSGTNEC
jgi:hypothetical protein